MQVKRQAQICRYYLPSRNATLASILEKLTGSGSRRISKRLYGIVPNIKMKKAA